MLGPVSCELAPALHAFFGHKYWSQNGEEFAQYPSNQNRVRIFYTRKHRGDDAMNFIDLCKCYVWDVPVGNKRCYVRINYDEKKKQQKKKATRQLFSRYDGQSSRPSLGDFRNIRKVGYSMWVRLMIQLKRMIAPAGILARGKIPRRRSDTVPLMCRTK